MTAPAAPTVVLMRAASSFGGVIRALQTVGDAGISFSARWLHRQRGIMTTTEDANKDARQDDVKAAAR
jgi:hypothetical protein